MMRLIGLDPGLQRTGWGLIENKAGVLRFVGAGAIASSPAAPLAYRLDTLYRGLKDVIAAYRPSEAAVEETVVNRNPGSSLKLGHARGVVLLAAAHAGLPVSEYAAKQVKRALTGTGAATKEQVGQMVKRLLPQAGELCNDAADALAAAICHAHCRATSARVEAGLRTLEL